ncbi:hypothetical protein FNV43_RR24415 [Rhamnella rubrinervis]|uniref:Myb/SANT-like domain-containing protein n=1 Tax=Rhamnella rubrinervis TaxID=2594499 RepID=A0A8K0DQH7_9ROSA|nr:hypothetical protein FNV43_RR24415 [Rhamnella rubrinervis]
MDWLFILHELFINCKDYDRIRMRSRRVWTREEEEALLDILDDIVARGQRCDTGFFKAGTMTMIERSLTQKCPESGLKINPHIESKLKKWKKQYRIVYDILSKCGFGWNDTLKRVDVDSNEAWKAYVEPIEANYPKYLAIELKRLGFSTKDNLNISKAMRMDPSNVEENIMAKKAVYVVFKDRQPGICSSWHECQEQVNGFKNNSYQSYVTIEEAEIAYLEYVERYLKKPIESSPLQERCAHFNNGRINDFLLGCAVGVISMLSKLAWKLMNKDSSVFQNSGDLCDLSLQVGDLVDSDDVWNLPMSFHDAFPQLTTCIEEVAIAVDRPNEKVDAIDISSASLKQRHRKGAEIGDDESELDFMTIIQDRAYSGEED